MPIYTYKCPNCKQEIEVFTNKYISVNKEIVQYICEYCGNGLKRSYNTTPMVIYTGSGFYSTDDNKVGT